MTLDELIEKMAGMRLGDVVGIAENGRRHIWWFESNGVNSSAQYMVARLYTDAIFNNDLRCIQTIINRIDGGLPKDTEVANFRTSFADAVDELLAMPTELQHKPQPDDTVMMVLAKSLYDIAVEDIYWDEEKERIKKPSDTKKQQRDNAMRMLLERAGGRKTKIEIKEEEDQVQLAPWIQKALGDTNGIMEEEDTERR